MIQTSEIFVILVLALIVLGPQRLPEIARKLGKWSSELRRAAGELRAGLEAEVADLEGIQSELRDVRRQLSAPLDEVSGAFRDAAKSVDEVAGSVRWIGPKPVSGPTPADAMADLAEIEAGKTPTDHPETDAGDGDAKQDPTDAAGGAG